MPKSFFFCSQSLGAWEKEIDNSIVSGSLEHTKIIHPQPHLNQSSAVKAAPHTNQYDITSQKQVSLTVTVCVSLCPCQITNQYTELFESLWQSRIYVAVGKFRGLFALNCLAPLVLSLVLSLGLRQPVVCGVASRSVSVALRNSLQNKVDD